MPELHSAPTGLWNFPDEAPTHNDSETVKCFVIVKGGQNGVTRVEEAEYNHGEWDISNAWNILAWLKVPENPPLTLEQLRQMKGFPVWVMHEDGSGARWGIVDVNAFGVCANVDCDTAYWFTDYCKNIAYIRKPE